MIISDTLDRTLGDKRHVVTVELAVHALMESSTSCHMTFEEEVKTQLPADVREAVENGVQSAYLQGNRNGCFYVNHSSHPYLLVQYCSTVESINLISCAVGHSTPFPGPVLGFPVEGVKTVIQHVRLEPGTSAAMVSACVSRCMLKVFKRCPVPFPTITFK